MDGLDRKVASPIASFIADLKWWIAGGEDINRAFEALKIGVEKGIIPEDVGLRLAGELLEGAVDLENELGQLDLSQAEQALADGLGIPIEEARKRITDTDGIQGALDNVNTIAVEKAIADGLDIPLKDVIGLIDGEASIQSSLEALIPYWNKQDTEIAEIQTGVSGIKETWDSIQDKIITITVKYKVQGEPPRGFQHGGSMIVPPGFPNDTFPIMVSSGERVDVTPRGGGIGTFNLNQTINASRGMDLGALADIIMGRINEATYNAGRAGVNYTGI
jgi:subtilisin family serine protease